MSSNMYEINKNTKILVIPVCAVMITVSLLLYFHVKMDFMGNVQQVLHEITTNLDDKLDRDIQLIQDVKHNLLFLRASTSLTSQTGLTLEQIRVKSIAHEKQMNKQVLSYESRGRPFWQVNWEPSYTCTTHVRMGRRGDGGKWVCDPEHYLKATDCVVYSIGSNGDFSFEQAIHTLAPKCEIHTMDSGPPKADMPAFVNYHQGIMGGRDSPPERLFTPASLMRTLSHTNITILKMDCDGCEYDALIPPAFPNTPASIQQILFEVHYTNNPIQTHALLRRVTRLGYAIFSKEPNLDAPDGCCVEYSVVYLPGQLEMMEGG